MNEICLAGGSPTQRLGDSRLQSSSPIQLTPLRPAGIGGRVPSSSSLAKARAPLLGNHRSSYQILASFGERLQMDQSFACKGFLALKPMLVEGLLESLSRMGV